LVPSTPFISAQDEYKNQPKIFLKLPGSEETNIILLNPVKSYKKLGHVDRE
jgi:hypothetical protein